MNHPTADKWTDHGQHHEHKFFSTFQEPSNLPCKTGSSTVTSECNSDVQIAATGCDAEKQSSKVLPVSRKNCFVII